jgi:hypothetical protein
MAPELSDFTPQCEADSAGNPFGFVGQDGSVFGYQVCFLAQPIKPVLACMRLDRIERHLRHKCGISRTERDPC